MMAPGSTRLPLVWKAQVTFSAAGAGVGFVVGAVVGAVVGPGVGSAEGAQLVTTRLRTITKATNNRPIFLFISSSNNNQFGMGNICLRCYLIASPFCFLRYHLLFADSTDFISYSRRCHMNSHLILI